MNNPNIFIFILLLTAYSPYMHAIETTSSTVPSIKSTETISATTPEENLQAVYGEEKITELINKESGSDIDTLIIRKFRIRGLRNIKENLLRSQIKTREGDVFDKSLASKDIKRLMDIGVFENVDIEVSTLTLKGNHYLDVTFNLKEKPLIGKIKVHGNKGLSKSAIRDALSPSRSDERDEKDYALGSSSQWKKLKTEVESGAYLDEHKLAQALVDVQDKYEEKAIFGSSVTLRRVERPKKRKVDLHLDIIEGKRAKIREISLIGFKSYKEKKIRKRLKTKKGKRFNFKKIFKGKKKIESLYKEHGWLDFHVNISSDSIKELDTDKEIAVKLIYTADEGKRHYLTGIRFTGNLVISSEKLKKLANLRVKKILKQSQLDQARGKIFEAYYEKGYLFADIAIKKEWQGAQGVVLVFDIAEHHKVYIGDIYIEGLVKTKEYVVRREILLKEGDLFNSAKLRRSQEKIFNLGFFEDFDFKYDPTANPKYVDLIFDLKEGRPGMLTAGAGFSSVDGVVGTISLQHLNLLGRAQRVNLSTEFGKRRQSYDVTWTTPWTLNRRMSTSLSLFDTNRSLQYASNTTAFKKRSRGGRIFLSPRSEDDVWIFGVGYTLQRDEIYDVLEYYKNEIQESRTTRSSVDLRASYDTRDYRFNPTRGTEQTVNIEIAGGPFGGNVHFVKPTTLHAIHVPTFAIGKYQFVFSSALRLGVVKEFGKSKDVFVSDRFFVGGAETVRGYSYSGQIGPPGGGKAYMVGNFEYKIPLLMERRVTIIQGALFCDFGGAWSSSRSVNLNFGTRLYNLKAGIGFGIRFKTPAFPVRLDWGWGLHHAPGEERSQFYFTIGSIL
ncbi:outer membrane protein assembly factor BamA [Elusimicrobiota bacterium]